MSRDEGQRSAPSDALLPATSAPPFVSLTKNGRLADPVNCSKTPLLPVSVSGSPLFEGKTRPLLLLLILFSYTYTETVSAISFFLADVAVAGNEGEFFPGKLRFC